MRAESGDDFPERPLLVFRQAVSVPLPKPPVQ